MVMLASCNGSVPVLKTQPTQVMETALAFVKTAIAETQTAIPTATPTFLPTLTPLPTFTPLSATLTSPLPKGIFDLFQEGIFAPDLVQDHHDIIKTAFGVITPDSITEEEILVETTMGDVEFSLFWEEGDLDLTLIQPDGKVIQNSVRERYYFFVPQVGTWTMRISGKSVPAKGINYMVQATTMSAIGLHYVINPNDPSSANDAVEYKFVPLQRSEHFSGDPIAFNFGITDSVSGSLLTGREYIHGVSMNIIIEDPAKTQYSFELYDDGNHEDGKADDGVYGNVFTNTSIVGTYNIYLQISGKNNRAKEPFTREYLFSIVVK